MLKTLLKTLRQTWMLALVFLTLFVLPALVLAQGTADPEGWQAGLIKLITAGSPFVAWLAIAGIKKFWDKIPKIVTVALPTIIGVVIGLIVKLAGGEENIVMQAVWTNLAIAVQEIQQKVAEMASDGQVKSLPALFLKKSA